LALERIYTCWFNLISVRLALKIFLVTSTIASSLLLSTATFAQTPPADTGLIANPVYVKNCAKCHGKTGEGRHFGGPSLVSGKTVAAPTLDLENVIANGKGHMPSFAAKLTKEEIDTLVRQIQALDKK
jgi:mono/diheme cytochrome c family protein